jgi:hypothetical protein
MRFYKSETLTICTKSYLKRGLKLFDEAIIVDPTLITKENKILRKFLGYRLKKCIFGICFYNSRKLIAEAKKIMVNI